MSSGYAKIPRIVDLANQLEADIRHRELKPGDPYMSLAEASRRLGVGTSTANRALQLLAQRKIIQRVQRRGSFIGSLLRAPSPGMLKRVFMLVNPNYLRQEGLVADGVLVGIHGQLPGSDVQLNFLPATDPAEYVHELIGDILRSKEMTGIVMTKVPFIVQRAVQDSGLPAVVHGSLYPSIEGLAWIDQDCPLIAKLVADYAIGRSAKHVCVLARDVIFPGDDVVHLELGRLLEKSGFGSADFTIRHLPDDPLAVQVVVKELAQLHQSGLCLLCRSELKAEAAAAAIDDLELKGRHRPMLVLSGLHRRPAEANRYPYVYSTMPPEEIGAAIGRLLAARVTAPTTAPGHIAIPLELVP